MDISVSPGGSLVVWSKKRLNSVTDSPYACHGSETEAHDPEDVFESSHSPLVVKTRTLSFVLLWPEFAAEAAVPVLVCWGRSPGTL